MFGNPKNIRTSDLKSREFAFLYSSSGHRHRPKYQWLLVGVEFFGFPFYSDKRPEISSPDRKSDNQVLEQENPSPKVVPEQNEPTGIVRTALLRRLLVS